MTAREPAIGSSAPDARFGPDVHRRIGSAAVQRGYLSVEHFAGAMYELGQNPNQSPRQLWIRADRLDRTELAEVIHHVTVAEAGALHAAARDELRSTRDATDAHFAVAGAEQKSDDPEQSYTLADVQDTNGFGEPISLVEAYEEESTPEAGANNILSSSGIVRHRGKERYLLGGELGRGGVGRVLKAFDRALGRTVAMKLPLSWPLSAGEADRFIEEAQATGQLEHPNIVPIYDIGQLESGEFYYTMKRVRSHTLRDVLDGLKASQAEIVREYGQTRLLSIFLQVCQAVNYAHVRGVIHRDLKPDNIMLGDYGEVHVMDWGLARVMDRDVVTNRSLLGGHKLESGQTVGTPAYMPPEQAAGKLDEVDEQSDVYSLGVILYEIMTLRQPSTRSTVMATLMAVLSEPIPPPSQVAEGVVTEAMEAIILRALERTKADRYESAKTLHDAVESYLDGRNDREAQARILEGESQARLYENGKRDVLELMALEHEASSTIEDWQAIEIKRRLWDLQDRRRQAATQMVLAFGNAIREFTQALAYVPGHASAMHALARLYFSRYELAEREGNELDKIYYLSLLEQYDDGTYRGRLRDSAPVSVYTNPSRAGVFLYRYAVHDQQMVPTDAQFLGETPLPERFLDGGRYLLRIKHAKYPAISVPLHVDRADPISVSLTLPNRDAFQPGFVYVAGGEATLGGDPDGADALPATRVNLDPFFIKRLPVTFAEYCEYLNHLAEIDLELAYECAPRTRGARGVLVRWDEHDGFTPDPDLIDNGLRGLYPRDGGFEWDLPVFAIRQQDAITYAEFCSGRDGVPYRLPTEIEWEFAGRGPDGRVFPWGDRFDATFCKMASSRPTESQPEPVGAFAADRSPYEVLDLAGGIREWTATAADDELLAIGRGGYWSGDARACRLTSRWRLHKSSRYATVGFRLAYDQR